MNYAKGLAPLIILLLTITISGGAYFLSKSMPSESLVAVEITPKPTTTPTPLSSPQAMATPGTPSGSPKPRDISISGFSYEDRNDDGKMNGDDTYLPNMQIYFYDSVKPSTILATVFTTSNGSLLSTQNVVGDLILTPSTYNNFKPNSTSVTVSTSSSDLRFPFRSLAAPSTKANGVLEGNVYLDANKNLARDPGEINVYFYKLYLKDNLGNYYNTVENAQSTDTGGHFKYVNLPPGRTFTFILSNPVGWLIQKPETSFTLTHLNPEYKNIELPVYKN